MLTVLRPMCRRLSRCKISQPKVAKRSFSASSSSLSTPPPSTFSALGSLASEFDKLSPGFAINPDKISILQTPSEFYSTLKSKILQAKKSVYLSTLYIGLKEVELIETIRLALAKNPDLKISILTDALRGTRETPNSSCASLLAPLISEFGEDRVEIRMYHTPNLTGLRKAIVPRILDEGWGVQHVKLYGFDDEVILSGANLSEDYFTNRQDRYHVFESSELAGHFRKVHSALCSASFRISPSTDAAGYSMDWPESNPCPSPLDDPQGYRQQSTKVLAPLLKPAGTKSTTADHSTVVYPILQFTPILRPDTSTELPALLAILKSLQSPPLAGSSWTFTAGYFNMTPTVRRLLLSTQPSKGTVIAASPWSNSFLGAPGIRGMLPDAYTHLSKRFVDTVRRKGLSDRITLREWRRGTKGLPDGWTYHAKGIWVSAPGETKPSLTIVGSSNYTRRSYELDLEANAVIVTRDESLMRRLGQEERWLQEYSREVGSEEYEKPERRVGWKVRMAMLVVRILGGAL